MEQIYRNIKARRKELGMTQQELARKMEYKNRSTIAKIESGGVDISLSTFFVFTKILETTPFALIGEMKCPEELSHENEIIQLVGERLYLHPEYGELFKVSASVRPEDVERVVKIIRLFLESE